MHTGEKGFTREATAKRTTSVQPWDSINRNISGSGFGEYATIAVAKSDDLFTTRHPGESRGPEHLEKTGFRLPPE